MNRRPAALLAAATMTAAVVFSLTSCGGGSTDSEGKDKIAGADDGASKSASPSASDDGIDRPRINLPKDVKDVFEGGRTGDPKKDAVLADNARRISSVTEAVTVDAEKHPALKFYSTGDALLSAANHVKGFYKKNKSFVGTTRYYDRKVTFLKDGAAAVTYCMDATKTYPKDRKSGKVDRSIPASAQDYSFYNTRLEKNEEGVWQTTSVLTTVAAKRCMP
ncbi:MULTISPECIES: hypothetical protein [Streptomyces]|uniref:hypothetical protein n=1 Tax=Streptomyces TaxID=1883 RepID=UPI001E4EA6CC|nr:MULTISPECIES: hypothetical protein [Streptomyces]UFQ15953.1 hypothetical protein J2N69_13630 [Streptomyces huasconensis]WCL85557.1 hypothetical protein PPN52_13640 [Streptomyces sp. JCM 35825]